MESSHDYLDEMNISDEDLLADEEDEHEEEEHNPKEVKGEVQKDQQVSPIPTRPSSSVPTTAAAAAARSNSSKSSSFSSQVSEEVGAMLSWLYTFPQITNIFINQEMFINAWQSSHHQDISRALLQVASEIFNKNEINISNTDTANWNIIYDLVGMTPPTPTPMNPNNQQQNDENHHETHHVRYLAASKYLLCAAVTNECQERSTYIGRIMTLEKDVQRHLMEIIESVSNEQEATVQEEDGERDGDDGGDGYGVEESYLDDLDIDSDNESLLDDQLDDDHHDNNDHHGNDVEHNHEDGTSPNSNTSTPINNKIDAISERLSTAKMESRFLSPLAAYNSPMFQSSGGGGGNAGRSRNGRKSIDSQHHHRFVTTPSFTSPQNNHHYQFQQQQHQHQQHHQQLQKLRELEETNIQILKQNQQLEKELEITKQQENNLLTKLEETQIKHRSDLLSIESQAIQKENTLQQQQNELTKRYESLMESSRQYTIEINTKVEEINVLHDEIDILKHSHDKLIQTEEQLHRLKDKMEDMKNLKDALDREMKLHTVCVTKCLELENELVTLQPLRRQLEDYKTRTVNAEVQVIDYRDDVDKLRVVVETLQSENKELQSESIRQQAENESIRRQLEQDTKDSSVNGVGEGMTELNPALKEELARLRNENKRLNEFASKRNDDSVQLMEEKLDDVERLGSRFKEQYISTKSTLESTEAELESSKEQIVALENCIIDLESEVAELNQTLKNERSTHKKSLLSTERKFQDEKRKILDNCRVEKETMLNDYEDRLAKSQQVADAKYSNLMSETDQKQSEMKESMATLRVEHNSTLLKLNEETRMKIEKLENDSKLQVERLQKDHMEEHEKLREKNQQDFEQRESKHKSMMEDMEKEYTVRNDELKEEVEQTKSERKTFEQKVKGKVLEYGKKLKLAHLKIMEATQEKNTSQDRCKQLEKEKVKLKDENERFRRQLGGRFGSQNNFKNQYEELQREYDVILQENRSLKKQANTTLMVAAPPPPTEESTLYPSQNTELGIEASLSYDSGRNLNNSSSSIAQLRAEYEERIEELIDEKRGLVMKNSAACSDVQKAQMHVYDLETQIEYLKNDKTSLQLQLARAKRNDAADSFPSSKVSGKRLASKLSPSALASKAQAMWKTSKISKASNSPHPQQAQGPSLGVGGVGDENVENGASSSYLSPSNSSTTPRFEIASPVFKNSIDNFKTKLHGRLSTGKGNRRLSDVRSVENVTPKRLPLSNVDENMKKTTPPRLPKSLIASTSPSRSLEAENGNPECTQS